jgi:hypothetical protein
MMLPLLGVERRQNPLGNLVISWWRREDSNLRHGAYETPALPPELRRRARTRAGKLQGYGTGVKRAAASRGRDVPENVPVSFRATSWRFAGLTMW